MVALQEALPREKSLLPSEAEMPEILAETLEPADTPDLTRKVTEKIPVLLLIGLASLASSAMTVLPLISTPHEPPINCSMPINSSLSLS